MPRGRGRRGSGALRTPAGPGGAAPAALLAPGPARGRGSGGASPAVPSAAAAAPPLPARLRCALGLSALAELAGEPRCRTGAGCRSPRSAGLRGSDPASRYCRSASGLGVVQGAPQKVAVVATVVAQRGF